VVAMMTSHTQYKGEERLKWHVSDVLVAMISHTQYKGKERLKWQVSEVTCGRGIN